MGSKTWDFTGIQPTDMEVVPAPLMDKTLYQMAKGWVLYISNKEEDSENTREVVPDPVIESLCKEFSVVFEAVKGLPPKHSHDHQIPLLPGTGPINIRPYRHPWEQKNTIEKMVDGGGNA